VAVASAGPDTVHRNILYTRSQQQAGKNASTGHAQMDGQVKNVMLPTALRMDGRGIKQH